MVLDAQYEGGQGGQVLDAAVLIACGVDADGRRDVLGCSVSLSEAEGHWRAFLTSLKDRGLYGIELIASDAHEALRAARRAVFPSVPWQRCQFHLQQNAGQYEPSVAMRGPVAADIRAILNAPDQHEAERLLEMFVDRYQKTAPKLATWAEEALPQGHCIQPAASPPASIAYNEPGGAIERGDPSAHACRAAVPQRGIVLATGVGGTDGKC